MRKVRFYFILGFVFLIVQLLLAFWSHHIVTKVDSVSAGFQKQQQQQHKQIVSNNNHHNHDRPPDGSFNGFPVFYHDLTLNKTYHSRPYSSVRCVGENYQGDDFAWMHRSCHFRFLCFNVSSREFEVYARPDDEILESIASRRRPLMDLSASVIPPPRSRFGDEHNKNYDETGDGVSLGSGTVRHPRYNYDDNDYDRDRSRRVKETHNWFPTVVRSSPPEHYYALEEDMVFVPFHSVFTEKGENRGKEYSVVWDDLFPIYTLLNMFQLASLDTQKEALLMRYVSWGERMSNSDRVQGELKNLANDDQSNLQRTMDPFRPLMMRHDSHDDESRVRRQRRTAKSNWTSQVDAILMSSVMPTSPTSPHKKIMRPLRSGLVCARDGVAGLGPHGIRTMNGKNNNMGVLHNQGKGGLLWMFRNYCVDNLGLLTSTSSPPVTRGRPEKSDVENTSSTIRIMISAPSFATASTVSGSGDGTPLQIKNHLVDFKPIEIGLRDYLLLSMNQRGEGENDENIIIGSSSHHRVDTTTSRIEIESLDFSNDNVSMTSRIKLMMDTTVFIATCSDATATAAIFLPQGASLIVFYSTNNDNHEVDSGAVNGADGRTTIESVCLDYRDLLNNLSHVFVHWLPVSTMYSEEGRKALFDVVKHATRVNSRVKKTE
jgi:hypothetical protein